jgi:hypothetical protein
MLLTITNGMKGYRMVESRDKLTLLEVARELGRSLEQVRRYVREGSSLPRSWGCSGSSLAVTWKLLNPTVAELRVKRF